MKNKTHIQEITGYEPTKRAEFELYDLFESMPSDGVLDSKYLFLMMKTMYEIIHAWRPIVSRHVAIEGRVKSGIITELSQIYPVPDDSE